MKNASFYLIPVSGNKANRREEVAKKEAKVESEKTKKAVKTIQSKVEKATLGDLGALAEIKEKLKEEEKTRR